MAPGPHRAETLVAQDALTGSTAPWRDVTAAGLAIACRLVQQLAESAAKTASRSFGGDANRPPTGRWPVSPARSTNGTYTGTAGGRSTRRRRAECERSCVPRSARAGGRPIAIPQREALRFASTGEPALRALPRFVHCGTPRLSAWTLAITRKRKPRRSPMTLPQHSFGRLECAHQT